MAKKNKKHGKGPQAEIPRDALTGRELSNAIVFFHEAVAARLGMSSAEWKCLGLLEQHGAMPASRLAALSGFTTGAITGIVDRLEKSAIVRRAPHPTDRRSVIIKPVDLDRVRERVEPIFSSLAKEMKRLASNYSAAELETIAGFMGQTAEVLREQTARLRRKMTKQ